MLAKIFLEFTEYAWFRRLVWKPIYQLLASKFKNDNWHYMNYGYNLSANEMPMDLPENNVVHKYQVQLYHYLAIELEDEMKWKRIKESIPKWLHSAFGEFGGAVRSQTHLQLKNRDLLYYRFKFQKEI